MSGHPARCLVRGSINIDEFYHVQDIVRPGETISSTDYERRAGGKGANQAAAVARAGGNVALVGAVGEDGSWVIEQLRGYGVDVDGVKIAEGPTGRAIIQLSSSGENCIILHKGANYTPSLPSAHFSSPSSEALTSTITHVLLQNEVPFQTTVSHLTHFHHQGAVTVFNPSPMPSRDELLAFPWKHLDWLLVNEGEAESLLTSLRYRHKHAGHTAHHADPTSRGNTQRSGAESQASSHTSLATGEEDEPEDLKLEDDNAKPYIAMPTGMDSPQKYQSIWTAYSTIKRLHAHKHFGKYTNIVCTLGALGVIVLLHDQQECLYLPAAELKGDPNVRDTTGAGDCFAGYFVRGLMQMYEQRVSPIGLREVGDLMRVCVTAGGMCVERRGAMESIPTSEEVQERLAQMP